SPYYKGPVVAPCPVVLTVHDLYFIGYGGRRRPLRDAAVTAGAPLYARRARAIVTGSAHPRQAILRRVEVQPANVPAVAVAAGDRLRSRGAAGGGGAGSGGRRRGRRGRARRRAGARAPRARASRRPATPRPRARARLCARPHRRPRARPPREPRRRAGGGDAL